jgi:hypothetical protein
VSEIGTWDAWSGAKVPRTVARAPRRQRKRRVTVQREIQVEIRALEERLANPGPGDSKESLAGMFAAEFREFGSSGRVFDAETVLGALGNVAQRPSRAPISLEGFRVERVAPNVVLATYLARVPAGPGWKPPTLRSSLWCKREGRWQIVFHQGTPTPSEASAP